MDVVHGGSWIAKSATYTLMLVYCVSGTCVGGIAVMAEVVALRDHRTWLS